MWREQATIAWSLLFNLLLAAKVWSFARLSLGFRVARLVVLLSYFRLVGRKIFCWPFGFFGRYLKVVWPKMFSVGRFWKYVNILRLKTLSNYTFFDSLIPCVCVSLCVVNYKWKQGSVRVRFVLAPLCRPYRPSHDCACVYRICFIVSHSL